MPATSIRHKKLDEKLKDLNDPIECHALAQEAEAESKVKRDKHPKGSTYWVLHNSQAKNIKADPIKWADNWKLKIAKIKKADAEALSWQ